MPRLFCDVENYIAIDALLDELFMVSFNSLTYNSHFPIDLKGLSQLFSNYIPCTWRNIILTTTNDVYEGDRPPQSQSLSATTAI